ncbi:hypothetical protein Poly30_31390 [Planctomycetes bacterium Poly30]|uniref:Cytochrome b562 n=1 Tax=Saltatorellus ferox TaxID=2528018 RepID=A0A518EU45_9BACT|nr:hypothetical protein Poly30_31390 [Planctomycetes bacterium Poly30]
MMNLSLSTAAPFALALTIFGGTAISRSLVVADASAADASALTSLAQDGEKHDEHEHGGVLHESMERMQSSMKGLRKMLGKPDQKAEAIALCVTMEGAALEGFMHPPESPDGLEGAELHAYQAEFKKQMLSVTGMLVDLEIALQNGDDDKAKELYRGLGAIKKEGHEIYIK